ncbi:MAG: AAA family ATPase, partial [Planctomycetes bacterium]|nr:AAA family ATPase [Planctomycetota bacterium]
MSHKLDKVTIRGFKSIRELEDFELRDINVLIGGNGSGKTNFIDFFRLLQSIIEERLNDFVLSSGGIEDILFNGPKVTEEMKFETMFGVRGYRFSIFPHKSGTARISDESRYYAGGKSGWWHLSGIHSPDESLLVCEAKGPSGDAKYSKHVYDAVASWRLYHFHDTSANAKVRRAEIIQDNEYLRNDGSNIAPFLLKLKSEKQSSYPALFTIGGNKNTQGANFATEEVSTPLSGIAR